MGKKERERNVLKNNLISVKFVKKNIIETTKIYLKNNIYMIIT